MDLFPLQQNNYTLIAATLAVIIALYFLSLIFKTSTKRRVPEATGAWPLVGHMNIFGRSSQLPHITLASMADKIGPIFTIRLGIRKILIVSDWEIAKEIFTTHDAIVASRPKYTAAKILGYNYVQFGSAPYGPYWREMRKITALELLSSRRLEQLKHVRVSELANSVKNIYEVWREKRDGDGKVMVEMKKWFGELNLNVMLRMVAGKRSSGGADGREVMRELFRYLGLFVVADTFPFLGWLDLGGHVKNMKRVAEEFDCMVAEWLEEHRRKKDSGEGGGEKDFIDVMMAAVESGSLADYDADTVIKSTVMVLIASSVDTTTVMLTWVLSLLLNNPHALQMAQQELDKHVGKQRQVNESDIQNLVYLQAIVKETLRLYPAGPLGGPREFAGDCTVAGYHVPKGTWLMVNMWKLQRDPKIWSNPSEFRPERFISGDHGHVDVKGANFELIPFGVGRRCCPGIAMALQMLHIILATLIQNFDMSTPNNAPVDMSETVGMTNVKASPLDVLIAPRLSSTMW